MGRNKGTQYPIPDVDWKTLKFDWALDIEQGLPLIHKTTFAETPRRIRAARRFFQIRHNNFSTNCFYSGIETFATQLNDNHGHHMAFAFSLDHLLPARENNAYYVGKQNKQVGFKRPWTPPDASIVIASRYVNRMLGHDPLSYRLLFRRYLSQKQFNRQDQLNLEDTSGVIIEHHLDLIRSFIFHGKFPWQPHAYSDIRHRRAAREFTEKLLQMDREFIQGLTFENRFYHFDNSPLPLESYY